MKKTKPTASRNILPRILLACALYTIILIVWGLYWIFTHLFPAVSDLNYPEEEHIAQSLSSGGKYRLEVYANVTKEHDTVLVKLFATGAPKGKNIYWGYNERTADIVWQTDSIVKINGKLVDVTQDVFDWREEDVVLAVESPDERQRFVLTTYRFQGKPILMGKLIVYARDIDGIAIYWAPSSSDLNVKWIDNSTIDVNGMVLNVEKDSYDWRNEGKLSK